MRKILSFIILFFFNNVYTQVVYEPLHKDVYNFLERLSHKGIIEFDDLIKPLSRIYIAEKLMEVENKVEQITSLEKRELNFFKEDYYQEFMILSGSGFKKKYTQYLSKDPGGRYRAFSYADSLVKLNFSPILGIKKASIDNEGLTHIWNGVYLYGYLNDNFGFSFDFHDNKETGSNIDRTKSFSPVTGIVVAKGKPDEIQYSEAKVMMTYDWNWGSISVGKDFMTWGYGESGKLVMSDKAPSFPLIRLDFELTDWLRFNYFHAWLSSNIIDSTQFYATNLNQNKRILYRQKYLASHSLIITPFRGLDFSLGESIVYSDRLEIAYLIPFSFFRLADHYLSRGSNDAGSNAQFFASISSKNHIPNTHLYATAFIDEITLEDIFDATKQRNQLGFNIGASISDLPLKNLRLKTEFTKIFPFVYKHYIPTQNYESSGYVMGHWMGSNADIFYAGLDYRIIRGLQFGISYQFLRKGEAGEYTQQYSTPQPPFLFGLRSNYSFLNAELLYEPIHELLIKAEYKINKSEIEQTDNNFIKNQINEFGFSLYYGL